MRKVRLMAVFCAFLSFFMFWGEAFGASGQEKTGVRESLQEFARDTIMGKVLNIDDKLAEGAKKLHTLASGKLVWKTTSAGLEYIVLGDEHNPFIAIRIDPEKFAFTLCMASEQGQSFTVEEWAHSNGLLAAINASMFLPDEQTSTGYMQSASHSNNERIGSRLGAFFVAEPLQPPAPPGQHQGQHEGQNEGLHEGRAFHSALQPIPSVALIEKSDANWEKRIRQYAIRVQNFRLLARDGAIPWPADKGNERGSIAAIGQEQNGKILFLVSVHPLTIAEFVATAKAVAPLMENAMYVEGSVKVGLYLDKDGQGQTWLGRKNIVYTPAPRDTTIPNVLGVVPREKN